jgi:hypothetical protein
LAASFLLAVGWLVFCFWSLHFIHFGTTGRSAHRLQKGCWCYTSHAQSLAREDWVTVIMPMKGTWWFPVIHRRPFTMIILPLWIPFLIIAVPPAHFWWRDRRRIPLNCCQGCGYDLMGNVSGVCPECGKRI